MKSIQNFIEYIQGIEITQIIDVIIAIAIVIIALLLSPIITYLILKIFFKKTKKNQIRKEPIYSHIKNYLYILGIYIATRILNLTIAQDEFFAKCLKVATIWFVCNVIAEIVDINKEKIFKYKISTYEIEETEQDEKSDSVKVEQKSKKRYRDRYTLKIISQFVRITLYLLAIYFSFKVFNFDLKGVAAGIGIGSAIVALAAQDIVKQLISGFAILTDKPFEVGDWVTIEDKYLQVIEITWRSTKFKTLEDTIVTIDNGVLVNSSITNWGKIKKRVFKANLKLAFETDEQTIEKVITRIKFILSNNSNIIPESILVGLDEIKENYLNINIYLDSNITGYDEFIEFKEDLNLTLLNILESLGVSLAYPGQNIYIKSNESKELEAKEKDNKESNKNKINKQVKPIKLKK